MTSASRGSSRRRDRRSVARSSTRPTLRRAPHPFLRRNRSPWRPIPTQKRVGGEAPPGADPLPEIADLPLDRRIALTSGADTWHTAAVPEADVPALRVSDGPNGARGLGVDPDETSVCFPVGS